MKNTIVPELNDDPDVLDQKIRSQLNMLGKEVLHGRYIKQQEPDKVSFRCSPIPSLLNMIDDAADRARRDRSDWIRQSLYIVATAELAGVNVQELLRRYMR